MARGSVRVEGVAELQRALRGLDVRLRKRVVRKGLRRGAALIRDEARRRAPRRTSDPARTDGKPLHKAIVSRGQRRRRGRDELTQKVTGPPHAHLVEYGTGPRPHPTTGTSGVMPAQPFMRPAYDAKKREALAVMRQEIADAVRETGT